MLGSYASIVIVQMERLEDLVQCTIWSFFKTYKSDKASRADPSFVRKCCLWKEKITALPIRIVLELILLDLCGFMSEGESIHRKLDYSLTPIRK